MLRGVKRVALLTLLCFGCTTVRVAVTSPSEVVDAPGSVAPPVVELWLESPEPVQHAVSDAARTDAEAAISQAVYALQISPSALGAQDPVLFVRERGVTLTSSREHQQTWAKIGIVAAVAAVVVAAVASSRHGGGGGHHFTRAAVPKAGGGGAVAVRPVVRPVTPIAARPPRYLPRYSSGPPIFIGVSFYVPPRPLVLAPDPDEQDPLPFPPDGPLVAMGDPAPPGLEEAPDEGPPPPEAVATLELPPLSAPADFDVDERGFFDGNRIGLQLDLLDRATGQLLWSKPVSSGGNPCSESDVSWLLREALHGQTWARPAFRAAVR